MNVVIREFLIGGVVVFIANAQIVLGQERQVVNSPASDEAISVHELQQSRSKYLGRAFSVEGRLTSFGANSIRLRNCDVLFRTKSPIPTQPRLPRFIEFTGRLTIEEGRYV